MPRIAPLPHDKFDPDTLAAVKGQFGGMVPNLVATFAVSAATLDGYFGLAGGLAKSKLTRKQREIIALSTAQVNGCDYCLSAHTLSGKHAGLSAEATIAARKGQATDPADHAVAAFAHAVAEKRGHVSDAELEAARAAGLDDALLIEIVALVVENTFTNFTNNVAKTEIDFPKVDLELAA